MLFKKKILSSSVALALVGSAIPAFAQDGAQIEEVIVEGGIRASLKRAMDIKRDSAGVADAISAEDMGKFPDTNLAESLQRVTGVSISRQRGEGSQVTVRGFGPEYNLVTLNGRQMPTHNGTNRSFDFGDLASEGISAVVVHKTGNAAAATGGVGSNINIITTKPLEAGKIATFGAKMAMDTSTETGDDVTPEFSGLYSNTFADDTVGIAISASSQRRNNAVNIASIGGWHTSAGNTNGGWSAVPINDDQVNRPTDAAANISIPQSNAYRLSEYESERVNGQLTLQWAPSDNFTATVDYTYSEMDLDHTYSDMSAWYNLGDNTQTSSWDDGLIASPIMYSEASGNSDFAMGTGQDGTSTENDSFGLNLEWQVTDQLSLAVDYHNSGSEQGANSPNGTSSLVTMASFNRVQTTTYFDQDLPVLHLGLNSGADGAARPLYKADMIITGSVFSNVASNMDVEQSRLIGKYDADDATTIDFGIELTEVTNIPQASPWNEVPGVVSQIPVISVISWSDPQWLIHSTRSLAAVTQGDSLNTSRLPLSSLLSWRKHFRYLLLKLLVTVALLTVPPLTGMLISAQRKRLQLSMYRSIMKLSSTACQLACVQVCAMRAQMSLLRPVRRLMTMFTGRVVMSFTWFRAPMLPMTTIRALMI